MVVTTTISVVMDLVDLSASPECVIQALQYNIRMRDTDAVKEILVKHFWNKKKKLSDLNEQCYDLLHVVVKSGSCDILYQLLPFVDKSFLAKKINTNEKSNTTKLLCSAVEEGHDSIVNVLCNNGADVNTYRYGNPLLHFALSHGHFKIAESMIVCGADVRALDKRGESVFTSAIISNTEGIENLLDVLVTNGADPHLKSSSGKAPIHVAAEHSAKAVTRLASLGCDVNTRDIAHSDTPLHKACRRCCRESIEILIKSGAKFNLINSDGDAPLDTLLKFATDYHDFHSQSRIKLARILFHTGFKINNNKTHQNCQKRHRSKVNEVYEYVVKTCNIGVPSLQHSCRLVIRDSLKVNDINLAIRKLDIPSTLYDYISFKTFKLDFKKI